MGDTKEIEFRIGSRKSELALKQTNKVIDDLKVVYPHYKFKIVEMSTLGDRILDVPLPKIGEKSLFTKELEQALEIGSVDFVVHSLKDLPTTLPDRKIIGAVLKRLDPRDCVIFHEKHKNLSLGTLPPGSVIGTSSLRRTAQIGMNYPHLKVSSIRGNLNTRLRKLNEDNVYDAIVLATAGVERMGWLEKIGEYLNEDDVLYAVGQGALAVECQENNYEVLSMLTPLIDRETLLAVIAERSFLRKLEGGCSAPVAVNSYVKQDFICLTGLVSSLDGNETVKQTLKTQLDCETSVHDNTIDHGDAGEPPSKRSRQVNSYCGISPGEPIVTKVQNLEAAEKLGTDLADLMIKNGALDIMEAARKQSVR